MRPLIALLSMTALGLLTALVQPHAAPPPEEPAEVAAPDAPPEEPAAQPKTPGAPGVRVADAVERYAVAGATEAELLASLVDGGPRVEGETFFGLTVTQLSFRYWRQTEGAQCVLGDVVVELTVQTTLPAWTPPPEAPPALRSDWARFERALTRHEAHHRAMAVAWAERVRAAVDGLAAPTCDAADADARRLVDRLRIEADAEHRRYDGETGHGLTEGATWPPPR